MGKSTITDQEKVRNLCHIEYNGKLVVDSKLYNKEDRGDMDLDNNQRML